MNLTDKEHRAYYGAYSQGFSTFWDKATASSAAPDVTAAHPPETEEDREDLGRAAWEGRRQSCLARTKELLREWEAFAAEREDLGIMLSMSGRDLAADALRSVISDESEEDQG